GGAAGPGKGASDRRDQPEGDPQLSARVGQGEHRRPDAGVGVVGPGDGRRPAGVDRDHGQVGVDLDPGHPPHGAPVVSSPRMLWALGATSPSASTTPDPRPRPRPIPTTDGPTRSATCRTACSSSSSTLMRRSFLASNLLIASY